MQDVVIGNMGTWEQVRSQGKSWMRGGMEDNFKIIIIRWVNREGSVVFNLKIKESKEKEETNHHIQIEVGYFSMQIF